MQVSTGFVVLLGGLFYLDEGVGILLPGLAACALHELGHLLAVRALGGRVEGLRLTAVGAELTLDTRRPLSYGKELAVALAGPVSSFLWAWLAAWAGGYLLAGMCLGQGLFNLLPILPLDGGRALYALLAPRWGGEEGERALAVTSAVAVGGLLGLGLILLRRYGNLTLAITSVWLLAGVLGDGWRKKGSPRKKCLQSGSIYGNILQSQ